MRFLFYLLFISIPFLSLSQTKNRAVENLSNTSISDSTRLRKTPKTDTSKAPISLYKIYSIQKDTTIVDTTLSIQKEYKYNLLRKDLFGLLAFANEGHTYNTLDFNIRNNSIIPSFGFTAKHFNYLKHNDILYYNVPTPITDLYFKTVMEQGQSLDAFVTVNTKPNLNFSIAYKGLRSIGKYVNNIASSGNFRFTTSYFTTNKKYYLNAHFAGQDISNQENGGIVDVSLFETNEPPFEQRERLEVYFEDATSLLKGNRFFIDHNYNLLSSSTAKLLFFHQFNYEYKFFEFTQPTVSTRYGQSFSSNISNKTRFNSLYNKVGLEYQSNNLGTLSFSADYNNINYFYRNYILDNSGNITVPNALREKISTVNASYLYNFKQFNFTAEIVNSITDQDISSIKLASRYRLNDSTDFFFTYTKSNTLPNFNFNLYQSDYVNYNWHNNFKNEKKNQFELIATTKWFNATINYNILNDYLYFYNVNDDITNLEVKPFQYNETINYYSVKVNKEIKFGKFALDNTLLFQEVNQDSDIINVPQIVSRNTLYFSDFVFKKAMFIQTGFVVNYFSKYFMNDYDPLIGEFYVQNQKELGAFPLIDFFINAKVRQTRIFLKAEHFNSAFTGYNYYSAPNYPYRDFLVRFGLVWNFFK